MFYIDDAVLILVKVGEDSVDKLESAFIHCSEKRFHEVIIINSFTVLFLERHHQEMDILFGDLNMVVLQGSNEVPQRNHSIILKVHSSKLSLESDEALHAAWGKALADTAKDQLDVFVLGDVLWDVSLVLHVPSNRLRTKLINNNNRTTPVLLINF